MSPESELKLYDANGSWMYLYMKLRNDSSIQHDYSFKDSRSAEYRSRNRYRDVNPYDHSRVKLKRNDIDYINASLVKAEEANRQYILTQGPLPHTSGHFWLMVWEQKSKAVLMLNRVMEKGQVKCHQYYPVSPEPEQCTIVYDDVGLSVSYVDKEDADYYTIRTLNVQDIETGESREVLQFHYTMWPDFGVPDSPEAFLIFLQAVRQSGALDISDTVGPPVIHCSAGIGRSGTFCLVDTCLVLIAAQQSTSGINVMEILMDMRRYRMGLIQTADQLRFSYLAIIEGTQKLLNIATSPDSGFDEADLIQLQNVHTAVSAHSRPYTAAPCLPINMDDISSTDEDDDGDINDDDLIDSDDSIPDMAPPPPPVITTNDSVHANSHNAVLPGADVGGESGGGVANSTAEPPPLPPKQGSKTFVREEEIGDEPQARKYTENTEYAEIRRRKREDRKKATAETIERMKEKQRSHEKWRARKSMIKPWAVGLALSVLLGSFIAYKYYLT